MISMLFFFNVFICLCECDFVLILFYLLKSSTISCYSNIYVVRNRRFILFLLCVTKRKFPELFESCQNTGRILISLVVMVRNFLSHFILIKTVLLSVIISPIWNLFYLLWSYYGPELYRILSERLDWFW